jgi:predicted transcriptional regulator
MNKKEFWRLQKVANLSNKEASEYLGVSKRTIERYRVGSIEPPKAVILAMEALIKDKEQ